MNTIFDCLRELTIASIALRFLFALISSGIIGLEREFSSHGAGFRTHILICLGASMTMIVAQYITSVLGLYLDTSRMGASVISGIGFIGAGSILVSNRSKKVKGLTTAAGLWTTSIIGLAYGIGFFEVGLIATILVIFTERVLYKIEINAISRAKKIELLVEYYEKDTLKNILEYFKNSGITIIDMKIMNMADNIYSAAFRIHLPDGMNRADVNLNLKIENVIFVSDSTN